MSSLTGLPEYEPARALPASLGRPWLRRAVASAAAFALSVTMLVVLTAQPATAATKVFFIDSLAAPGVGSETLASAQDANAGDGICADASGRCTLLAAVQEANATSGTGVVEIRPAADVDSATTGVQATGTVPVPNSTTNVLMHTGAIGVPNADVGAYYHLTRANVALDLERRLAVAVVAGGTNAKAAVFYVDAADVTIRGFTAIKSAESSVVVSGSGDRAVISDGVTTDYGATLMKRFLVVTSGADDVTIHDVELASWNDSFYINPYGNESYKGGAVVVDAAPSSVVRGLTVERVHFTGQSQDADATSSYGSGGIGIYNANVNSVGDHGLITGLTVTDSVFDQDASMSIALYYVRLDGARIEGNSFTSPAMYKIYSTPIELIGATTSIRNNFFSGSKQTGSRAMYMDAASGSDADVIPLVIEDNTFSCAPSPKPADGAVVKVTAADAAGNTSAVVEATVDAEAPAAAVVKPSDGASVAGSAEPGSTVTVTDADGEVLCSTTAGEDGTFACTPSPKPGNGATVKVAVTDPAGNTSPVTTISVDAEAPGAPEVTPSNGSTIAGSTEPGATVTVRDAGGEVLCSTIAGEDGTFACALSPVQEDGAVVKVTATDPAGNTSPPVTVTIDAEAPGVPVADPSDGSSVSGSAEPGSTVTVTDADGEVLCMTTAGEDGTFSCTPSPKPADGETVKVTITDPAGNTSQTTVTIDAQAPDAPSVTVRTADEVAGTAEPGSTVTVTDAGGDTLCTTTASEDGMFTCTLDPVLADGAVVKVTATDPAGNHSPATEVTVDAVVPGKPSVKPSDGSTVAGTAEPGSTVTVTDGDGNELCSTTAGEDGTFACAPSPKPGNGATVKVATTDPAGNTSPVTSVTVDAEAGPVTIDPSNGSSVSGSAEPGATVTVTDDQGTELCTTTADGKGAFSCTPDPKPANGDVVTVTVTDPAGNAAEATVTVDAEAPAAPSVPVRTAGKVAGTAEPGSIVTVTGPNGVLCTATADQQGEYSCVPLPSPADGVEVSVTATDPAGNTSPATTAVIDAQAPDGLVVDPSDGSTISGNAEPGSTVTVTDGDGNVLCAATADADGRFACEPSPKPADGTTVTVTVSDPAGNTATETVKVDATAPAARKLSTTDGKKVSGTGEPGAIVTVTGAAGTVLCTAKVAGNGAFSCVPLPQPANGDELSVTLTDTTGNQSKPATVTVKVATKKPSSGGSSSSTSGGTATTTTAPVQAAEDPATPDPAEQSPSPQPTPPETTVSPSPSPTVVAPGDDTDPAQQGGGWHGWGWIIGFLLLAATGGSGWWLLARRGNRDSCPVCGASVDQGQTLSTFTVDDRSFYFCSDQCRDAFIADLDRQGRG